MKKILLIFIYIIHFSANAETFNCIVKDKKNIIFDRVGHSHFKKCIEDNCDKDSYGIIHTDEKFLIFGNFEFQKEKQKNYFQIFIIDKELSSFSDFKIILPLNHASHNKNEMIVGKCTKK